MHVALESLRRVFTHNMTQAVQHLSVLEELISLETQAKILKNKFIQPNGLYKYRHHKDARTVLIFVKKYNIIERNRQIEKLNGRSI